MTVSLQWCNLLEFLPGPSLIPIVKKLRLMKCCPLDHKTGHARERLISGMEGPVAQCGENIFRFFTGHLEVERIGA